MAAEGRMAAGDVFFFYESEMLLILRVFTDQTGLS